MINLIVFRHRHSLNYLLLCLVETLLFLVSFKRQELRFANRSDGRPLIAFSHTMMTPHNQIVVVVAVVCCPLFPTARQRPRQGGKHALELSRAANHQRLLDFLLSLVRPCSLWNWKTINRPGGLNCHFHLTRASTPPPSPICRWPSLGYKSQSKKPLTLPKQQLASKQASK